MDRLKALADLVNGGSGIGERTVDAEALRGLLAALSVETALLLLFAVIAVSLVRRALRHRGASRAAAGRQVPRQDELAVQLAQMVHKTNERNNYINSIFASIEDGFVLVDSGGRIVLYNPRARELLGLGPQVFFGEREQGLGLPMEAGSILELCVQVTRTRRAERREVSLASGLVVDARVLPVANKYLDAANLGSLAVIRDITEMRKLENIRKDFVATVSHEFRTPLTLISGFMEMLRTRPDIVATDRERAFEIMEIETERLKRLVSELLTLSEIENSLPGNADDEIDVADILRKVVAVLGGLAEKKGQVLSLDLDLEGGTLRGNEGWFWQAVMNLVENAIKYTPEKGSIHIEAAIEGPVLKVSVSDTGIGIAEDERSRIFERFYRVEKSRGSGAGGSGLGLALVKDIAAIFNGKVSVESEAGKGSTFTIRLPVNAQERRRERLS